MERKKLLRASKIIAIAVSASVGVAVLAGFLFVVFSRRFGFDVAVGLCAGLLIVSWTSAIAAITLNDYIA